MHMSETIWKAGYAIYQYTNTAQDSFQIQSSQCVKSGAL